MNHNIALFSTLLLGLIFNLTTHSQNLKANFNSLSLDSNGYYNGSDGSGGFYDEGLFFKNEYTPQFMSWVGWSYAARFDTLTAGFTNQYSTAAGQGVSDIPEEKFALAYVLDAAIIRRTSLEPFSPRSVFFTNNTFAYLSMKNGDSFSKKFGGSTGNDPDFFKIIIRGFRNGQTADTTSFYLADFRFTNNSQDYIIKDWTSFNFPASFQSALFDSLTFELASSDVGAFGINTPTYFCLDEFEYSLVPTSIQSEVHKRIKIFPNPVKDQLFIRSEGEFEPLKVTVADLQGKEVLAEAFVVGPKTTPILVSGLKPGLYFVYITGKQGTHIHKVLKQ